MNSYEDGFSEQYPGQGYIGFQAYGALVPFNRYAVGDEVEIDLMPETIDDISFEEPETILGKLLYPKSAIIEVTGASKRFDVLGGRLIGLAANLDTTTPPGIIANVTFRTCVSPGAGFAYYYFPGDAPDGSPDKCPPEYHHAMSLYARLRVANKLIFDLIQ